MVPLSAAPPGRARSELAGRRRKLARWTAVRVHDSSVACASAVTVQWRPVIFRAPAEHRVGEMVDDGYRALQPASSGARASCASSVNGWPPPGWAIRRSSTWRARRAGASRRCFPSSSVRWRTRSCSRSAGTRRRRCSPTGSSISCSPGPVTEPGTDPMAVGARLLDLLDRLQADGQVVVLAIDDLQWADRPSSRAVLFALRRLRADKVLAVVSTRAGELADPGWARFVGGDSRVTRIRLGGLSPGELTELAGAPGAGRAVAARGVPAGCSHRRQRALLPGAARRDRHRRAERGRGIAGCRRHGTCPR